MPFLLLIPSLRVCAAVCPRSGRARARRRGVGPRSGGGSLVAPAARSLVGGAAGRAPARDRRRRADRAGAVGRPSRRHGRGHTAGRVRLHCHFVLPRIHFIPYALTYSVPLSLKRQSDRTLTAGHHPGRRQRPRGRELASRFLRARGSSVGRRGSERTLIRMYVCMYVCMLFISTVDQLTERVTHRF